MLSSSSFSQININLCWTIPLELALVSSGWAVGGTGHCQREQFVLAYSFDQKQSANMPVTHRIFLSIWNVFRSNWFLSPFLFYFISFYFILYFILFYVLLFLPMLKAVIPSERGQTGSMFSLFHAKCWGEGERPSHRYCLADKTVCQGSLLNARKTT